MKYTLKTGRANERLRFEVIFFSVLCDNRAIACSRTLASCERVRYYVKCICKVFYAQQRRCKHPLYVQVILSL